MVDSSLRTPARTPGRPGIAALWRPSLVVAALYIVWLAVMIVSRGYTAFDFIHLGTVWGEHKASGTWGYDGQFYYQIARDPLHAYRFMDNAPYRYQRILYPLLVFALSLGNGALVPYMLLLVNLLAVVGSVEIVARILKKRGMLPWFSLALGLYFGQFAGLTFDTSEPLMVFWLCLGVWLMQDKRYWLGALSMGLAALTRETAVLFPVCYGVVFLLQRRWREILPLVVLGGLPILLWLAAIQWLFGQSGLGFSPPFERVPFGGIWYFANTPRKFWLLLLLMLLPMLANCLQVAWECWKRRWSPLLLIWIVNLLMIVFLSHFSYIELISCSRISLGLICASVLYAAYNKNRLLLWFTHFYTLTCLIYMAGILLRWPAFIG